MPIQAPQWTDFRLCPVCQNEYNTTQKPPISLGCGHSICQSCLFRLSKQVCPFDQAEILVDIKKLPINYALLSLVGGKIPDRVDTEVAEVQEHSKEFNAARKAIGVLAQSLQNVVITGNSTSNNSCSTGNGNLTRPMQRKLVTLLHSQLAEVEGRSRAMRSARSIGERAVKELILMHQSPQTLSAALWAAVRQRGCQFLGPAMQEAVLRLILLSLEDGISLSRKVLVLFVVQRLEKQFTQASKTSIGHVVQLLYRASCFKVTKRDGDSSLLQLHEKYRTYSALRKEHDAQIVQIAMEAGLHISPEQWSALLYGDDEHKSHMQSIIDKLQTPASFASSIQELIIALQRTDDPHNLQDLQRHLDRLAAIDPSCEAEAPVWRDLEDSMSSLLVVVSGLQAFSKDYASKNKGNLEGAQIINTKYRTSMCRDILQRNTCPRGSNCNFAHSEDELERYRKRRNLPTSRPIMMNGNLPMAGGVGYPTSSRSGSNSSPDSCADLDEELDKMNAQHSPPVMNGIIPQGLSLNHMNQIYHAQATPTTMYNPDVAADPMTESFKAMNMRPQFPQQYAQQQQQQIPFKKEEQQSIPAHDMIKMAPSYEGMNIPHQPQIPSTNRPIASVYQQVPYQPASGYFDMRELPQQPMFVQQQNQQQQQQQQQQYIQANPMYQVPPMPQMYSYQQEYASPYPPMFANGSNLMMRTAVARGSGGARDSNNNYSELMKNQNELKEKGTSQDVDVKNQLSIPPLKENKDDWKLATKPSSSTFSLDSGRGSSIGGYSSSTETFSPLSSTSNGSRNSPPSNSESEKAFWDVEKIWGRESSTSKTWSNNGGWDFFDNSRISDPEERNTSSESVGATTTERQINLGDRSYSSMKNWSSKMSTTTTTSTDLMNNNTTNQSSLLGLLSPSATRRGPPPGFKLI